MVRSSAFSVKFTKAYFDLPCHAVCVTGTPGFIVDSMDFGICQAVIDHCEGRATDSYMEEESRKVLKIKKPHNLLLTLKRVEKYKGRGYSFAEEELDYLFSFFAVCPLSPGESPFANYRILSANPSRVEPVLTAPTSTQDDVVTECILNRWTDPPINISSEREQLFDRSRPRTAPIRNPHPLTPTRGGITLEELALLRMGLPRRRVATEEEIADAREQAMEEEYERRLHDPYL